MYYLEIVGHAFLWHQIRCIMAVLVLIGQGNEDPSIITELLDVERNPWLVMRFYSSVCQLSILF